MKLPFLLIPLLFSAGCEKPDNQKESAQVLHLNLVDDPVALDPRVVRSIKDLTLVKQLYEGLMRLDKEGIPQPAIAESMTLSKDLLTYTFHLRHSQWSNLEPLTAFHFEKAWKQALDPHFASDYAYMLYPIKNAKPAREGICSVDEVGVKALDDWTLQVELHTPTPYFLELLAFPTYFPVHDRELIFNGPFCLTVWQSQQKIALSKNCAYWDKESVCLDQIHFSIIADHNTEGYLFEKEELDWLGQPLSSPITQELAGKLQQEKKLDSYPIAGTFWFKFNVLKSPFDQEKVRKAFAYAMNRHELIQHILQGNQTIATGPLPPSMRLRATPYFQDGDLALAKLCFEEALMENNWTRETFPKVVLNYPPSERQSKIVQQVQQQWQTAFGIPIELQSIENQHYRRNCRQGLFQVGTGEWIADYHDPLAFLELFKELNDPNTGNGMNDTNWHHSKFTALLDASLTETDPVHRKELLQEAEQLLIEEMPIAPLYHYAFDYVKKPYVKGTLLSPLGLADYKSTCLEK